MSAPTVLLARGDQCQYDAEAESGSPKGSPILKPSGFLTNSRAVAEAFSRRCSGACGQCSRPGGGAHVSCTGKRAQESSVYPRGLRRVIIKGVTAQLKVDNLLKDGCCGVQIADDDAQVSAQINSPSQGFWGKYRDDLTGQVLKDSLVEEARSKELLYFHTKGVWIKVPKASARSETGRPPISVR